MITENYVSFEIAKLLKEKGFEECPLFRYDDCGHLWVQGGYNKTIKWHFPAPTLQMAMKWLREVHNIDIFPWKIGKGIYSCAIFNSNTGQDLSSDKDFPSEKYEEAAEAAVKYCLENLI
jgi:hypothetical protein